MMTVDKQEGVYAGGKGIVKNTSHFEYLEEIFFYNFAINVLQIMNIHKTF